mmetsp:Transcript_15318/g.40477  ORF Transcript_15318/g.40477 Transcript_15318/m.40477 type:complete len:83 (-) Transcript_15318:164-412(-)
MTHRRRRSLAPIFIARHHIISLNSTFQPLPADDGSGDVFVHQTRIHKDGFRSLAEGEPLEFKGEPRPPMPLSPIQPNARPRD